MTALAAITGLPWRLLAGVGIAIAIYVAGYNAAASSADMAALRQERDIARRDLAIMETMADAASAAAAAAEAARREAEQKVKEYAESLSRNDACALGDDDVRRLRDIIR